MPNNRTFSIPNPFLDDPADNDSYPLPALEEIHRRYPEVPHPYDTVWDTSDTDAKQDREWMTALTEASLSLESAAQGCRQLAAMQTPMTPTALQHQEALLTEAVFRAEELLSELQFRYPLPSDSPHRKPPKDLEPYLPKLLLCTQDRFLIWMPRLPAKSTSVHCQILKSLRQMLRQHDLPHIPQWHCDLIHAYPEYMLAGVQDVDNYPYKPIIDALAMALFAPDSFDNFSCAMYNLPTANLKPGCYIRICNRSEKVQFLQDFEKLAKPLVEAAFG